MHPGSLVSCVLWLGRFDPVVNLSAFSQMAQQVRVRHAALGLSGALIYDGERFCHLLEGELTSIQEVLHDAGRMQPPPNLTPLYASSVPGRRRFGEWRSGYCDETDLDPYVGTSGLRGEAALSAFLSTLPRCDLSN